MDTIFMNSGNSKTSDLQRLLRNLWDKINFKGSHKHVALSNLSIYYTWKNIKSHTKIINLNYQLRHTMKSLNYLVGHVLYQMFKIIWDIVLKSIKNLLKILQLEYM